MPDAIPYFDGHNDVLLRLFMDKDGDPVGRFLKGGGTGHLDLPRCRQGHFVGGLFALFSPPLKVPDFTAAQGRAPSLPLPPVLAPADAWASAMVELALLLRVVEASAGEVSLCLDVAQIRDAIARDSLAVVLHLEGADAIDEELYLLDIFYGLGLRSLGPVWSRPNAFGHGVPLQFPGSPDSGPGLTDAGKRLVAACNRKKIQIDLSHLNEQGFWDVAALSDAPLVATHSNVHAISPSPRNLTARQLDAIRDSDGFVGLNFATGFLRADGQMRTDTEIDWMVRHLDALVERLGEDRVGIGSDFDGAAVPAAIGSVAGSQALFEALRAHGYGEELLKKIGADNWLAALERSWR
ncbi:MAG: dipeptidase [Devosia sp.]|nr:dipeptidase [Devosia sp.]